MRANPLKLREYLAAGLPVVATPLPEVVRYVPFVRLAEGASAFATEIEAALGETSRAGASRRMESMRGESWDARVAEIATVIGKHPEFSAAHHD